MLVALVVVVLLLLSAACAPAVPALLLHVWLSSPGRQCSVPAWLRSVCLLRSASDRWACARAQVAAFDADGDGRLCYEEFRALLCDSATQQALKF